ncbi:hypothetical protein CIPAW_14G050100 [Carya illinoinensis]|uniref:Uncharacterized protein n=1 Tax=Carya illinoinensis TaxID=32201 RepID=A0A8T1NB88_CARIL|nr:hypothetical protein CIPAW_14G050100 [Carya illinoinensis]KAG6628969.1 hypothetical protein CIPAW_14G050100 [Carya illinoinensis]
MISLSCPKKRVPMAPNCSSHRLKTIRLAWEYHLVSLTFEFCMVVVTDVMAVRAYT